jgi:hypothetical protein
VRGRGHVTIQQLSAETALHPHDIALAFMLLGFIKRMQPDGGKFLLSIDWSKVESHMAKVNNTNVNKNKNTNTNKYKQKYTFH